MLLHAKGSIFLWRSSSPSTHAFSLSLGSQPLSFPSSYPTSHRWSWHGKWEKEAKPYLCVCVCLGEGTRSFLIPSFKVERVNDYGGADLVLTPCQTHPPLDGTKHAHPPSPAPLVSSRDGHISSDGFLKFGCLLFTCNLKVEFIYTHAISNWLSNWQSGKSEYFQHNESGTWHVHVSSVWFMDISWCVSTIFVINQSIQFTKPKLNDLFVNWLTLQLQKLTKI